MLTNTAEIVETAIKSYDFTNKMDKNSDKIILDNNIALYIGDCIEKMRSFSDGSIDLIITSPPYWGQRDYKNEKQWGNEKEVREYICKMGQWSKECRRILKDTGSLFLNIVCFLMTVIYPTIVLKACPFSKKCERKIST